jgi:hypothetical protein
MSDAAPYALVVVVPVGVYGAAHWPNGDEIAATPDLPVLPARSQRPRQPIQLLQQDAR